MSDAVKYEIIGSESDVAPGSKKRGRKSNAEIVAKREPDEIQSLEEEMALDRRLALIDERFGDGQPYDRTRLEIEVSTYLANASLSFLKAGTRLFQLKEHEGHGNFLASLERIGIGEDTAERMMLTARKLEGTKLANSETFRNLLPSKLYEIALFDEEQIDELNETGQTGMITLDEIQRMTVREAKVALREERERKKALEKIIAEKNEIINKQELQIQLRPEPSEREVLDGKLKAFALHFVSECVKLQTAMRHMRALLGEVSRTPGLEMDKARLADFRDEIVRYGTEGVIADWEVLTDEVVNLMPTSERPDVPTLG